MLKLRNDSVFEALENHSRKRNFEHHDQTAKHNAKEKRTRQQGCYRNLENRKERDEKKAIREESQKA
jgi:hypothetical protein